MDNYAVSFVSSESLIMSLLEQMRCLENERDNARVLAAKMRERLKKYQNNENDMSGNCDNSRQDLNNNRRISKLVKNVSSVVLNDLQQVIHNEEERYRKLKEICDRRETERDAILRGQVAVCKNHYERILNDSEREKNELRRKMKEQQDMLLDKDIKIKELERKLHGMSCKDTEAFTEI